MSASKDELRMLLERVKVARGPDRGLDSAVCLAIDERTSYKSDMSGFYTASIDAAVALVERCLPSCKWVIENDVSGRFFCDIPASKYGPGMGTTAPLAILAAMLSALIAHPDTAAPGPIGDEQEGREC